MSKNSDVSHSDENFDEKNEENYSGCDSKDSTDRIWLSIFFEDGKLGASCYDSERFVVFVLEDVSESVDEFPAFRNLIRQIQPHFVLATCQQDCRLTLQLQFQRYFSSVQQNNSETNENNVDEAFDFPGRKPKLSLVRAKFYDVDSCCKLVSETFKRKNQTNEKDENRSFDINYDAVCMIRSLSLLIEQLNLNVFCDYNNFENSGSTYLILDVKKFSLQNLMAIDSSTLYALEILPTNFFDFNPREICDDLSLFSLCQKCCSKPGIAELKRWFLRPLADKKTLEQRLGAIEYFCNNVNLEFVGQLRNLLPDVQYLHKILIRMKQGQQTCSLEEWITLFKTVRCVLEIYELFSNRNDKPELLCDLSKNFNHDDLKRVACLLENVLDVDEMERQNRFVVKTGVDEYLDKLEEIYASLPDLLTEFVKEDMVETLVTSTECSMIFLRNVGYLLVIPKDDVGDDKKFDKPGLEFFFSDDDYAYYKSVRCCRLDDELGDVALKFIDRQTSIRLMVQKILVENVKTLTDAVDACAQFDCLISLATTCRDLRWTKPIIVDQKTINIWKGWPHSVERFSTNVFALTSTASGISSGVQVHVITGPNGSGKSTYLKQLGVSIYLVHIGCFVPAETAAVGIIERLSTIVRTDGDVLRPFDDERLDVAISGSTSSHSLIIVDQFDKEPPPTKNELSSLIKAIRNCLKKSNDESVRHFFVSAHQTALLSALPKSQLLSVETMDVIRRNSSSAATSSSRKKNTKTLSQKAQLQSFVARLHELRENKGDSLFSLQELTDVYRGLNLTWSRGFDNLLHTLNAGGYLLSKGNRSYQIVNRIYDYD